MNQMQLLTGSLALIVGSIVLQGCAPSGRYADKHDSAPVRPPTLTEQQDPEVIHEPVGRGNLPYKVFGKHYTPMKERKPFSQQGTASWYGKKFHGHLTSNGEVYNMFSMSAAHKTLPLPSYVKVTNLANNKSAIVRVNDRGPFHQDRIIDLSYAAAFKIGVYDNGTADVKVELILPDQEPFITENSLYQVALTGFKNESEAKESLKGLTLMLNHDATLFEQDKEHKVIFGPFKDKLMADDLVQKIKQFGYQTVNLESVLAP
ncbi:septal ring lytic transglycosylase RlpA family protein [Psychrosphaera aestuarii]|uniref:septal ring lytic transglycosylase RlpA family protein n=1 Tax=Psychrosphaera aestuarii TaxID=1266052 RepID=UPI003140A19A